MLLPCGSLGGATHATFELILLMHLLLAALAVAFVIAGFVGFALGGLPTIVFWVLAGVCVIGAWKLRPRPQRVREDRNLRNRPR